jgi:hypothetical protein
MTGWLTSKNLWSLPPWVGDWQLEHMMVTRLTTELYTIFRAVLCLVGPLVDLIVDPFANFINILQPAFALIFFCQKLQSQTASREKLHKILL